MAENIGANASQFHRSIGIKCFPTAQMKCCIEGCNAIYGQANISFHRFPTILTARDALRRELWIEAAGLPNDKPIIKQALICGQHFERGKPSLPTEVRSPNWVPTLNLKTKKAISLITNSTETSESAVAESTTMAMNTVAPQRLHVPVVPIMGPQVVPKDLYLPAYCRLCLAEDVQMVFPKDARVYHQLADKIKECLNLVNVKRSATKYSKEDVSKAVTLVQEGMSMRSASKRFGIPKSTLEDRVKRRYKKLANELQFRGAPTALSSKDEKIIVQWIIRMANAGFPVNEKSLIVRVAEVAKSIGKETAFKTGIPSRGWFARFLKRHPELSRRTANNLSKTRIVTELDVRNWFKEVRQFLEEKSHLNILADSQRVFNMDESAFSLVPKKQRVLAPKGLKNVQSVSANSDRENYTVLMAASADGHLAPPLILFPYKARLPSDVVRSVPRDWGVGKTDSGWMNSVAFFEYISKVFYPWVVRQKITLPILLFVDGHISHASLDTVEFCKKHDIILVSLLPNSTHFTQPLDVSFFAPMKKSWEGELTKWRFENQGAMITRADFAPLLEKALDNMQHKDTAIINGFRKCGLVHFNPEAIDYGSLPKPRDAPPALERMVPTSDVLEPQLDEMSDIEVTEMADNQPIEIIDQQPAETSNSKECDHQEIVVSTLLDEVNRRLFPSQLELFEQHRNKLILPGPEEDTSLFLFWRKVKDEVEGPPEYLILDSPYYSVVPENSENSDTALGPLCTGVISGMEISIEPENAALQNDHIGDIRDNPPVSSLITNVISGKEKSLNQESRFSIAHAPLSNMLTGIPIGDLTRSLICKKCYETLEQLHQFRTRCARQNTYLSMRKSLEPDRKQPLRYKDNWYWYSCLGNSMHSVIWGCSVVCCPAFIVSHPSGKVCSRYANHQHKQKMDEVKSVYCNGEYIFDGFRYSFEMINLNRTLSFSCRSLMDPHNECTAVLITNDRSEVLSVCEHNHGHEIIIESAVKDGLDGEKRSITLIRGSNQEIVFCQGYWYTTVMEQSSISHWNCIRYDCSSTITMVNGIVQFFGTHTHLPVFLKWGAEEDKTTEPKIPTLMKVVYPPVVKPVPIRSIPPVVSRESTTIVHSRPSGIVSTARISESGGNTVEVGIPNENNSQSIIRDESLMTTIKVEPNELQLLNSSDASANLNDRNTLVRPPVPASNQPLVISAAAIASKAVLPLQNTNSLNVSVRSNHPIQVVKQTGVPTIPPRICPPHLRPLVPPAPVLIPKTVVSVSSTTVPKIVHVMSLNLAHSSNQSNITAPEVPVSQPLAKTELNDLEQAIKQEQEEEPETITDDVQPMAAISAPSTVFTRRIELPKPPPLTPRPMLLVSSASVVSDNTLNVTAFDPACIHSMGTVPQVPTTVSSENGTSSQDTMSAKEDEDGLYDLQDDEEIPPIIPIDADIESRIIGNKYSTIVLPNGKTQLIRKVILSRGTVSESAGKSRVVQSGQRLSIGSGLNGKSNIGNAPGPVTARSSGNFASISLDMEKPTKTYGPSPGAQKRINKAIELENSMAKKPKASDPLEPLETTIVDTEKCIELEDDDQDQSPAEDPIAVSTEPHQNVQSDDDVEEEEEEEEEDRSSNNEPATQPANNESDKSENEETSASTRTSTEKPVESPAAAPVPEQAPEVPDPIEPTSSPDLSVNRSEKKPHSKTVQLVKLQKTEQMLSHEGHLYKMKWYNRRRNYWDCMLREQVNCMAILQTQGSDSRFWNMIGSHNHKVPKPIINDDNRGRYQMLTSDSGVANVKHLPTQTLQINDIEEQMGRMMNLAKQKIFSFKIRKVDQKLTLYFANYEYKILNIVGPGFRWKCILCNFIIETDEKFTIAQEAGDSHNHEPQLTVIDLVEEGTNEAGKSKATDTSDSSNSTKDQPQQAQGSFDETNSVEQNKENDKTSAAVESDKQANDPNLPVSEDDPFDDEEMILDGSTGELAKRGVMKRKADDDNGEREYQTPLTGEIGNDGSDDDEMILDPSTGELTKRGDLTRKEYRKAILEDTVADDDDDEAEYLDPLTGKLRRFGDKSLSEDEPLDDEDPEVVKSIQQPESQDIPSEDFEELLKTDPKDSADLKKPKRPKKNSLAAMKLVLMLHKQLKKLDSERNFEVLSSTDVSTCLIRFNEFTYELDTIQNDFSVWKCHLSPQYACRGKVHLNETCKQVSVSGVNHCHVSTLKDMFIDRPEQEDGQIKDTDQDCTREYTFFKRPDHAYQLRLDDGYLYNCLTISKTGVSCWRCASRLSFNCKAIITMEGNFESVTRNRFSHSHDLVPSNDTAADGGSAGDDVEEKDQSKDTSDSTKRVSRSENEDDRKKRKRQSL